MKYCPYGLLVFSFPIDFESGGIPLTWIKKSYRRWLNTVLEGKLKNEHEVFHAIQNILSCKPQQYNYIRKYSTTELRCSLFTHLCPVFFTARKFTETKEERKISRTIPRAVMIKVVRRDGQICAICRRNIPDDKIEFDHIIPFSMGGPTTPENIRVLCRDCNRKKSNSLNELLSEEN